MVRFVKVFIVYRKNGDELFRLDVRKMLIFI